MKNRHSGIPLRPSRTFVGDLLIRPVMVRVPDCGRYGNPPTGPVLDRTSEYRRCLPTVCVCDNGLRLRAAQPVQPWRTGNMTLLGDAIHTMTPCRGEGANTA